MTINVITGNWRETSQKRALDRAITGTLVADPDLRPADVLIVLSPNARAASSFGSGLASHVADDAA